MGGIPRDNSSNDQARMSDGERLCDGLQLLLSMPTFVLHPQLLPLLATEGLATAKPGFLDRLIHAEATAARLPLVTFEKAATHLPHNLVLKAADHGSIAVSVPPNTLSSLPN